MNFTDILDKLSRFVGTGNGWGRWVGAVIVATVLFLWTYLSLKKGELIALDLVTAGILTLVFVVNAMQRPASPNQQPNLPGL